MTTAAVTDSPSQVTDDVTQKDRPKSWAAAVGKSYPEAFPDRDDWGEDMEPITAFILAKLTAEGKLQTVEGPCLDIAVGEELPDAGDPWLISMQGISGHHCARPVDRARLFYFIASRAGGPDPKAIVEVSACGHWRTARWCRVYQRVRAVRIVELIGDDLKRWQVGEQMTVGNRTVQINKVFPEFHSGHRDYQVFAGHWLFEWAPGIDGNEGKGGAYRHEAQAEDGNRYLFSGDADDLQWYLDQREGGTRLKDVLEQHGARRREKESPYGCPPPFGTPEHRAWTDAWYAALLKHVISVPLNWEEEPGTMFETALAECYDTWLTMLREAGSTAGAAVGPMYG